MSTTQYPMHLPDPGSCEFRACVAMGRLLSMADGLKILVGTFGSLEALPPSAMKRYCADILTWAKEAEGRL